MKQSVFLLLPLVLTIVACNDRIHTTQAASTIRDTAEEAHQVTRLRESLTKLDVPSQRFNAPADKVSLIRGEKGTVVFIAPNDLETDEGQPPKENITVELKELADQSDILRANAPTVSNGTLLVSGGAYYVNMSSGGRQLHLKKNKSLKVALPRNSSSEMTLFYGERDSSEQMNWQAAQKLSTTNSYTIDTADQRSIMVYNERDFSLIGYFGSDSTYKRDTAVLNDKQRKWKKARLARLRFDDSVRACRDSLRGVVYRAGQKLNNTLYDITELKKFGWINCDKFYNGSPTTNITYTIAQQDSITYAHVYLVFREINSVVENIYYNCDGTNTRNFGNIPIDCPARLIAVTYRKNQLLTCSMDITTAENQHTLVTWKPATEVELKDLFALK